MSPPGMFTQVSLQVVLVVGVGTDLEPEVDLGRC